MVEGSLNILLVEDSPTYALRVRELLMGPSSPHVVTTAPSLSAAVTYLAQHSYDIVLLDLTLPDSRGLATVCGVQDQAPGMPIVVLTSTNDDALAVAAVQRGAQDYLVKGQVDRAILTRSIRYSIERHRLLTDLSALSLRDDLTGLRNRRGFLTLAPHQIAMAARAGRVVALLAATLDNRAAIDGTWGRDEGDLALRDTAALLRSTFREADICARLDGAEFAVLATSAVCADALILSNRLLANVAAHNERAGRRFRLALRVGTACHEPGEPGGIDGLLARAAPLMDDQKRPTGAARP
ncbi:MAG: hypothetical protein NVSMB65_11000 [Chloroflexota bacterium]